MIAKRPQRIPTMLLCISNYDFVSIIEKRYEVSRIGYRVGKDSNFTLAPALQCMYIVHLLSLSKTRGLVSPKVHYSLLSRAERSSCDDVNTTCYYKLSSKNPSEF